MTEFHPSKSFFDFSLVVLDNLETMRSYGDFVPSAKTVALLNAEQNTPEARELLTNILKAALGDAHERTIVLFPDEVDRPDLRLLQREFGPETVLFFGYPTTRAGWSIQLTPYRWTTVEGCRYLLADALSDIAIDTKRKRLLWGALQELKQES